MSKMPGFSSAHASRLFPFSPCHRLAANGPGRNIALRTGRNKSCTTLCSRLSYSLTQPLNNPNTPSAISNIYFFSLPSSAYHYPSKNELHFHPTLSISQIKSAANCGEKWISSSALIGAGLHIYRRLLEDRLGHAIQSLLNPSWLGLELWNFDILGGKN
jgi:hypothetical protein